MSICRVLSNLIGRQIIYKALHILQFAIENLQWKEFQSDITLVFPFKVTSISMASFDKSSVKTFFHKRNSLKMQTTTTIYCDICDQYLKDFTKKQIFHHTQYHVHNHFKCKKCEHLFESVELLAFHRKKMHQVESDKKIFN